MTVAAGPARTGSTSTPTTWHPRTKRRCRRPRCGSSAASRFPSGHRELALEFMDAHGIAVQMLSVSDPGVEFVDHGALAPAASPPRRDRLRDTRHDLRQSAPASTMLACQRRESGCDRL